MSQTRGEEEAVLVTTGNVVGPERCCRVGPIALRGFLQYTHQEREIIYILISSKDLHIRGEVFQSRYKDIELNRYRISI